MCIRDRYNYVVWPWNMVMIALCLLLFGGSTRERYYAFTHLFRNVGFYTVVVLMIIMPFFSFMNAWPSYLSSSLYSGNTNRCRLVLSDKAYERLPYYIRSFATRNENYNVIPVSYWCITELKTPCYPEKPVYECVQRYVQAITGTTGGDVKIEFKERQKLLGF